MKTLVYKRTHVGDPNPDGVFGIYDCMGRARGWKFDAVIGVGGIGDEPARHGIAGKVTWIGIGPHRYLEAGKRGPVITFDRFLSYGTRGPSFATCAPILSRRIYEQNIRALIALANAAERREVAQLLSLAENAAPSAALTSGKKRRAGGKTKGCC
jgi:hypothetical protein